MKTIEIDGKIIGDGQPVYCIAEIGSNFNGDLEKAEYLVDLAIKSRADAVKFQSFITDKIISKKGFESLKMGFQANWKKSVYKVYKNAEFPRDWHEEILNYCKKKKITFFSAPYDIDAVDLLDKLNIPVFKIGSGDITWLEMIDYIAKKQKPIILATGASSWREIDEAVNTIKKSGNKNLVLLQCVTNYPSQLKSANIRAMVKMREKYDCLVGYSDHTPGNIVALGMTALGGCMIEKHFTDDKAREGPDHPFAMDANEFKEMVQSIRNLEKTLGDKKEIYQEEEDTVILQRRCLRAAVDITKNEEINREMIDVLRPAPKDSIYPKFINEIIGKKVKINIQKGDYLKWNMF
jgi:sialic acid synthase SpsE